MIVSTTHEVRKCNCCERVLTDRNAFLNNGSWQQDYITSVDIDLCYNCAGIIFQLKILPELDSDKLKDYIDDVREKIGRNNQSSAFNIIPQVATPFT